ncbi:DUF6602 domain-containing protein [Tardiphaga sp. 768_D3_N2_1]|uniref:DUF6602 domain-containing protein n=1 Tax=Tardiphaga sp. 768_D3_N2_1 TaxID=3240783 RepID=UPI003F8A6041
MGRNRFNQGHAIPDFVDKFGTALAYFSLRVRETANIKHAGAKGTERELDLVAFIDGLLPNSYHARKGEVVDLKGRKSPQLDVVIFDAIKNFPLYSGDTVVLPAEALLASVEVKSKLNATEVATSQEAARELKLLEPMKRKLGSSTAHAASGPRAYRYLHGLFAYDTDVKESKWAATELARFEKHSAGPADGAIDFVYVLNRGLIDTRSRSVILEDEATGQALVAFWFAFYNFIDRENRRRDRAPYFNYASDLNRFWHKI